MYIYNVYNTYSIIQLTLGGCVWYLGISHWFMVSSLRDLQMQIKSMILVTKFSKQELPIQI